MHPNNPHFTNHKHRTKPPEITTKTLNTHFPNGLDIGRHPTRWLWHNAIPQEQITVLAGQPGIGKTSIALDIAARISTGALFPFEDPAGDPITQARVAQRLQEPQDPREPAEILLVAPEDQGTELAIRIATMKGDLNRFHHTNGEISEYPMDDDPIQVVRAIINRAMAIKNLGLVIIDPLQAILTRNANSPTLIRAMFRELSDFAADSCLPILAIAHTIPSRISHNYRIMGSAVFSIAPRMIWEVQPLPNSDDRVMLPAKCIFANPPAVTFNLDKGVPTWLEPRPDLSRHPTLDLAERRALDAACDFLLGLLTTGPKPAAEIQEEAESNCINIKTLRRAQVHLNIKATRAKATPNNPWIWTLPQLDGQTMRKTMSIFPPATAAA